MKRISAVIGLVTLGVVPGHPPAHRGSRRSFGYHDMLQRQDDRAASARSVARTATGAQVAVAIDSETGEPCRISARQAGLLQPAGRRRNT